MARSAPVQAPGMQPRTELTKKALLQLQARSVMAHLAGSLALAVRRQGSCLRSVTADSRPGAGNTHSAGGDVSQGDGGGGGGDEAGKSDNGEGLHFECGLVLRYWL